jgi:hypothetical protein
MKYFIALIIILFCMNSFSQNKINIDDISFIEGFCNSNKSDLNSIININTREYFLEVTYIYPDGSQRIQTKSLVVK